MVLKVLTMATSALIMHSSADLEGINAEWTKVQRVTANAIM